MAKHRRVHIELTRINSAEGVRAAPATRPQGTKESMKGWEVYIWRENEGLRYALLEGTNRLKGEDEVAAAAVADLAAIKAQLYELKPRESVFMCGRRLNEAAGRCARRPGRVLPEDRAEGGAVAMCPPLIGL